MANHAGAGGAAMYGGMNAPVLPPAGQYSDMQLLMRDMDTLSNHLQRNRDEWQQVQDGLARVERMHGRLAREALQNGDAAPPASPPTDPSNPPPADPDPDTIASLQTSLAQAHTRIAALEQSSHEQQALQTLYEEALAEATERIRAYGFSQQTYLTELHRNYAALLEAARWETMQAHVTHQAWQDGLGRVSARVREALRAREDEAAPFRPRIAALKSENRILRQMVGWEPPVDSEDEEEGEDEEGVRGRASRQGFSR